MEWSETTVRREDLSLWVEHHPGPGPLCLLVSGAGAIAEFWPDELCGALGEAGYGVARFDHRDSGLSTFVDFARTPYALSDLVDDVVAIMDDLGAPAAHLVGHSMGGFVVQLAAIRHPGRVLSLTSMSSHTAAPDLPPPPPETWEVMLANQPRGVLADDLAGYLRVWRYLNGDAPFDEPAAIAYTEAIYRKNPATLPATNHVALQADMIDRGPALLSVRAPALVIHGERDPLVHLDGGRITAAAIPRSKLVVLPAAGHVFFDRSVWSAIERELIAHLDAAG